MKSFSDINKASPDQLEPTLPLPAGVYELQVIKSGIEELKFDFGDAHKEGDENLMIYLKPVAPIEVDEDDLAACEDWQSKIVSLRIFPEEMGDKFCDMKNERGFVYNCGLDPKDYENVEQLTDAVVGQRTVGVIVHAPNKKDPDRPYVNLKQTAPL